MSSYIGRWGRKRPLRYPMILQKNTKLWLMLAGQRPSQTLWNPSCFLNFRGSAAIVRKRF